MKILSGRRVKNFREAVELAFRQAGTDDIDLSVAELFEEAGAAKLRSEAERDIVCCDSREVSGQSRLGWKVVARPRPEARLRHQGRSTCHY